MPKSLTDSSYDLIHTWYTPSRTVTIISPCEVFKGHRKTYRSHTTHSDLLSRIGYVRLQGNKDRDTNNIYTSYENDLAYKLSLFPSKEDLDIQTTSVHSMSMDTTSVIWYQIKCRMHTKGMGRTSKMVNGLPPFYSYIDLDGFVV